MYGWGARIGLVIPSNNTVIEPEYWAMVPDGVSVHAARILSVGVSPEDIEKMESNAARAVEELHAGGLDVIGYACLATSLVKGRDWSETYADAVRRETGLPATTAATATVEGLKAVGAGSVVLATPYPAHINDLVAPYIESFGIEVVAVENVDLGGSLEVCKAPPDIAERLARDADRADADAICIVATDFRTIEVIAALERDLSKPVVTTNQALLWRCLRLAGVEPAIDGYGRLLDGSG